VYSLEQLLFDFGEQLTGAVRLGDIVVAAGRAGLGFAIT
jgi:hypothetical protein